MDIEKLLQVDIGIRNAIVFEVLLLILVFVIYFVIRMNKRRKIKAKEARERWEERKREDKMLDVVYDEYKVQILKIVKQNEFDFGNGFWTGYGHYKWKFFYAPKFKNGYLVINTSRVGEKVLYQTNNGELKFVHKENFEKEDADWKNFRLCNHVDSELNQFDNMERMLPVDCIGSYYWQYFGSDYISKHHYDGYIHIGK